MQKAGKDRELKKIRKNPDLTDIYYVRQKEQKELGDSITKGPVPCTKQLIDVYEKYHSSAISLEAVPEDKVERYGIISGSEVEDNIYSINELVEKPLKEEAPSNLAIMGRYVLTPDIFDKIDETKPGVGGEIQLTDALKKLDSIYGVTFEGKTYDIGNRLEWLKTSIEFAMDDDEFRDDLVSYMESYI